LPSVRFHATLALVASSAALGSLGATMFAALPLLALPVLLYNILVATLFVGGFHSREASDRLTQELLSIPMTSGVRWPVTLGDLLVLSALVILFIELLKSTTSHRIVIINHSLSLVLFIGCLVEFLLARPFATSAFFLITVMVLLDVLAGFIVTIAASRRTADFSA
jgi:hypothetical protein